MFKNSFSFFLIVKNKPGVVMKIFFDRIKPFCER
jgi:hypothetical protein